MQTWFNSLPQLTKGRFNKGRSIEKRKTDRKNRQRAGRRFGFHEFGAEMLEPRVLLAADLAVDKTSVPPAGPVAQGELVTYNVAITNTGITAASNVAFSDTLPAGLTFVSATAVPNGTVTHSGNSITGNLGTLLPLVGVDTVTIQAMVSPTASGSIAPNTATVTDSAGDTASGTTSSPLTVTPIGSIGTSADLSITKVGTPNPVAAGQTETYTLTVTNNDPTNTAATVVVTDVLPAGATAGTITAGGGGTVAQTGTVVTVTYPTLGPGASDTITIPVTATSTPGPMVNTAAVASATPDANVANNVATTTTNVNGAPGGTLGTVDLSVTKTGSPNPVTAGNQLTYTVTIHNLTTGTAATSVLLTDALSPDVTFVSASDSSGGTITTAGNTLLDTVPTLAGGGTDTVMIVVTPTAAAAAAGTVTNTAVVSSASPDTNPTNNTATVTTAVNGPITPPGTVDLSITKTASPSPVTVGQQLTYTVTTTNNAPTTGTGNPASNVIIADTLPANTTFVSAHDSNGGTVTVTGTALTDTLPTLASGATDTLTIVVVPTAAAVPTGSTSGSVVNAAAVTSLNVDTNPANNTATVTTPVNGGPNVGTVDLGITKTAAPSPVTAGQHLTYTVTTTNHAPTTGTGSAANTVVIADTLPANATFVSASDSNGGTVTVTGNTLTDTLPTLASGATDTLTIVVVPTALPAGSTSGSVTNIAAVTSLNVDTNPTNNTATVTTPVNGGPNVGTVDLGITKTAAPSPVTAGQHLTYTVTTTNHAPTTGTGSAANTVVIADTLPANATFVSASDSNGGTVTVTGNALTDTLPTLASGATDTLTIVVVPTALPAGSTSGSVTNTAAVTSLNVDTNPTNNTATVTTPVNGVTPVPGTVDLSIAKTAAPSPATVGQQLTYTVTTTNNAPTTGTGNTANTVVIADTLPANTTFVSAHDSNGGTVTLTGTALTDTLPTLASGATDTLTIVVVPTAAAVPTGSTSGSVTNVAAVTSLNVDTNPTNNTATVTTPVNGVTPVPGTVDLGITKTAAPSPVAVGQQLTYTVTTTNIAPATGTGNTANTVVIADALPANSTFVSANDSNGGTVTVTGNTLTDTLPTLASGATDTLTIVVMPTAAAVPTGSTSGSVTNVAAVTSLNVDTNPANNTATVTTPVTGTAPPGTVDLGITKTASPSPVAVGSQLTYTVTTTNIAPATGTGNTANTVVIADTLPANTTFVSARDSTGGTITLTGTALTDTLPTLASGATDTLTIVVVPTAAAATSGSVTNVAAVTSLNVDTNPTNNTATVTTPVTGTTPQGTVDLGITKTASPSPATVGNQLTYTVTTKNNATTTGTGNTANTVVIADTLPANTTFVSAHDSNGGTVTVTGNALTDTLPTLASGATDTLTIVVVPTAAAATSGSVTNVAAVTSLNVDTNPANNAATVTTPVTGTTPQGTVDLGITKTASPSPVAVGGQLTYTVTTTNIAPTTGTGNTANTVVIADTLPADTTFVSAHDSNGGTVTVTGNALTDTLPTLASGATDTLTIIVVPTAAAATSGSVTNVAAVTSLNVDTNPANNAATVTTPVTGTTPQGTVDLGITKTAAPSPVAVGQQLTYTVTTRNIAPTTGTGNTANTVVIADTLPANTTFVSAHDSNGGSVTVTGNALTDTLPTLASGATDTLTIIVVPTAAAATSGSVTNVAAVTSLNVDTNPANNAATVTTPVTGTTPQGTVDLGITKTASPSPVAVGQQLTYTVTTTNIAPTTGSGNTANTVVIADTLPANTTFVSAHDSNGGTVTVTGNALTDTLSTLASGATDILTIVVVPTAAVVPTGSTSGSVTNTAAVTSLNVDTNPANNTATVTTPVTGTTPPGTVDLGITKTGTPNPVTVGQQLTYTVTTTNIAPTTGTGNTGNSVVITDTLPADTTFVSAHDSNGGTVTVTGNALTDTLSTLAVGATDTLTIVVVPTAAAVPTGATSGSVTNVATVSSLNADTNPANNTATVTTAVTAASTTGANVSISKTAPATSSVGASLQYTVTVTNHNTTAAATAVVVNDLLPAGVVYVSSTDSQGGTIVHNGQQLTDTIASLPAGASDTITIMVTPQVSTSGTVVTNTANVSIATGNSGSPTSASASTTIGAVSSQANVTIAKAASPTTGTVGQNLTYTITVSNAAGSAAAAGTTVTDTLPAGMTFVSASASAGTASEASGTVTANLGTLAAGVTDTITIIVTPDSTVGGTSVTNTATVSTTTSNSNTNHSASVTTPIGPVASGAQLSISKVATPEPVSAGGQLTYTITVNNSGTSAASGAVLTDALPAGVTFVSGTDSLGNTLSGASGTVTDNLGSIAAGATDTMTVIVSVGASMAGQTITNTASLTSPDFQNGTAITATANSTVSGVTMVGPICYLAGTPGDGTATTFVHNLYRELLGREPDAGGNAFWIGYLQSHNNDAAHREQVEEAFLNSQEYKIHYVTCVYQNFLGRTPDAPGLNFWVDKMGNPGQEGGPGGSRDEKYVVGAIVGSDEFYIRSGNTPQSFVNALYQDIMGRNADAGGTNYWVGQFESFRNGDKNVPPSDANQQSNDGLVREFLDTDEAEHRLLNAFYPNAAGTAAMPLPAPGTQAGGDYALANVTGGGWENLFFQGPYGSNNQNANDMFFAKLQGNTPWDDVIEDMLEDDQYFANSNRPVTATGGGTMGTGGAG